MIGDNQISADLLSAQADFEKNKTKTTINNTVIACVAVLVIGVALIITWKYIL